MANGGRWLSPIAAGSGLRERLAESTRRTLGWLFRDGWRASRSGARLNVGAQYRYQPSHWRQIPWLIRSRPGQLCGGFRGVQRLSDKDHAGVVQRMRMLTHMLAGAATLRTAVSVPGYLQMMRVVMCMRACLFEPLQMRQRQPALGAVLRSRRRLFRDGCMGMF